VPDNRYDSDPNRLTIWQLLRNAGYRTLTCGKNDLHKKTRWKGLDGWTRLLGQYGFTDAIDQSGKMDAAGNGLPVTPHCSYTQYLQSRGKLDLFKRDYERRRTESTYATSDWAAPLERDDYCDDFCGRNALELLSRTPREGPWMLWVNFPGPHDPMDPPRDLQARYDGVKFPDPIAAIDTYENLPVNHQQIRRNYAAECEGIDEWVGTILDAVERRGQLDNTLVIFSSDHGEMLGDHGRFTKHVPYEGSVHVPLIVAGPGIDAGRANDSLVETIDIGAFILDRAGLAITDTFDARPFLNGASSPRDYQLSSLGGWKMVCNRTHKLVRSGPAEARVTQLFDLGADPSELHNIANAQPQIVAELSRQLPKT
jgi:choline-sulfatase